MANSIFSLFGEIFVDNQAANQAIDETDDRAKKTSGTFGKMGGAAKALGGFLGGALVAGAGAAVAGLGALFVVGDELQKSLNGLQTSTGATDEEMKGMEESLKNIYKNNYGESFEDIANSMANVKQSTGLAGDELESLTQNALMLRDTFEFEVAESTRAADTMMKNFGISGEEAMTLIAQGAQQGANKTDEMLDVINEYAPQFQSIGLDAEFFMDTLITGGQSGAFSIDKVGDAVKEMNIRMKDGNDATKEALSDIGLNAKEITTAFAEGGDAGQQAFIDVMNALADVEDPMAKNAAGVAIMGSQYEDLESKAIDALADIGFHTSMTADTLSEIDKIKYNTFGEALQGIGRNLLMGVVDPFQERVMPVVNQFANWMSEQMPIVEEVTNQTFTAIFSAAEKVWGFFSENILPIFLEWYGNINEFFPIIQQIAGEVFGALLEVAMSLWDFFVQNLLPIFVGLYEWIQKHMPVIRSTFEIVFSKIVEVGLILWRFFQDNILPILQRFLEFIQGKMPQIQTIVEGVFKIISSVVKTVWDIFENFLLPVLKALWDYIAAPAFKKIQTIVEGVFGAIFDTIEFVVGVFEDLAGAIETAIDWLTFWDKKEVKKKTIEVEERRTSSSGSPPRNAVGDNYFEGGYTLAGEMGPELIELPKGSKIKAANETRGTLENIFNFEGMMKGATLVIREESDIPKLARELWNYMKSQGRGKGVVM